eukprot:67385_1
MAHILLIYWCATYISLCNSVGSCRWSGINLEPLSSLSHPIDCEQNERYSLQLSPCQDGIFCETENQNAMILQWDKNNKQCRYSLSYWDSSVSPIYINSDRYPHGAVLFYYTNGPSTSDCPNGMIMNLTYICLNEAIADPYNQGTMTCNRIGGPDSEKCYWNFRIETKHACASADMNTNNGDALSTGSVVLIIFCVSLFLYCGIGYGFNGHKTKHWMDCQNNIPHWQGFWRYVPSWTIAGCKWSYHWCKSKANKDEGALKPLVG